MDLRNGKEAKQLWNLKKKMLSQKCAKQEEVDLSGGVGGMVNKVRKVLEELN